MIRRTWSALENMSHIAACAWSERTFCCMLLALADYGIAHLWDLNGTVEVRILQQLMQFEQAAMALLRDRSMLAELREGHTDGRNKPPSLCSRFLSLRTP
jgi:hypothetical protein